MPAYNGPQSAYLQNTIQSLQTQLNALGQQQQYVIVDGQLRLRVQLGLLLGDGNYGILLARHAWRSSRNFYRQLVRLTQATQRL